jgi:uncharacterized protein
MNIVISDGTEFIGRLFLTRRKEEAQRSCGLTVSAVEWNGLDAEAWEHCLDGADAIINLAGAPMDAGPMSANGSSWKVGSFPLVCL